MNIVKRLFFIAVMFSFLSCDFSFKDKEGEETGGSTVADGDKWDTARPLQEIYKNYFLMGNIVSPGDLNNVRFDILQRHYNTLTAENHMKPDNIAPSSRPSGNTWAYRFTNADMIVNAAVGAGMKVVGHTLIWHSQSPTWLTRADDRTTILDRDTALYNLKKYVTEVAGHFAGKILCWDVVNEAMRDGLDSGVSGGDWRNCLRLDSPWYRSVGAEFIEEAFLAAREADPEAMLFYNDYNLNSPYKSRAVYNMVKDINERHPNAGGRKLIDGIGMQSHHHLTTSPQTVDDSIELFASLGVDIAITELDIIAAGRLLNQSPPWNEDAAQRQAEQYAAMFRIFKKHSSKISRVTFWGIDDGTHWRTLDGSGAHAAMLDKDYGLKPAFYAVTNPDSY